MRVKDRGSVPSRKRSATLVVELLFVLPVLLIVMLATVEFSLWLTAQQQVTLASREGARTAAQGGSINDVQQTVQLVLGPNWASAAQVLATLNDSDGNPLPSGAPVTVLVTLPVGTVVPDLLVLAGFSIRNEIIASQTVMRKE